MKSSVALMATAAPWRVADVARYLGYSERYTEKAILKKAYDSEYVITLDELPKW